MKKIFRTLFTVFVAVLMTSPNGALATTFQEIEETLEDRKVSSFYDDYRLTFLDANFELTLDRSDLSDQAGSLMVFITSPDGKIVKDAQVVTTIIANDGNQIMARAQPFKGAFLIDTESLASGQYLLEAEIITNGCLLTEEFKFRHV